MVNFEAEKIEIERVLKRIEAAENCKEVDAMFKDMTEDSILQKCGAPQIRGLEAWREDYEQFFKSGFISTSITCLGREVSASGDMAWEYGSFVSEFEGPDGRTKSEGKYLGVWKKVDGKWKSAAVSISGNG
jgi:ketosteroid isomerase-like protein